MISLETVRQSLALHPAGERTEPWKARLRRAARWVCTVLLVAAVPQPAMSATVEDVLRVLEAQGIAFDTNKVFRAAAKAALRAVDFRAMILPAADLDRITGGEPTDRDETWESGMGYLQARFVDGSFAELVSERLGACAEQKSAGLILDLRGAGGAGLDAVDSVASLFVEEGEILYAVKNGIGDVLETREAGPRADEKKNRRVPLMLLVDGATHGTGELLAALLKGRPGVMLVGRKTMGDLGLRTAVELPGDEVAWLATRWAVPGSRQDIEEEDPPPPADGAAGSGEASEDEREGETFVGVVPDIEVSTHERVYSVKPEDEPGMRPMSEKARRDNELMKRVGEDAILRRAVDIILGLQAIGQRGAPAEEPAAAEETVVPEEESTLEEEPVPEDK